ncbi:hypothetical protein [Burkholderia contaminans]|uniref:hypothetical protein n=1 Tax=Burkholderia contaminans TaxID=488447 RepID=UPI00158CBEE1|nr:hypothetical protein [Burkholderia contaminans]
MSNNKNEIDISDHAVLRYLERIKGVDIEAVKREMLSNPEVNRTILRFNSLKIPFAPRQYFVVKDKIIITVLGENQPNGIFIKEGKPVIISKPKKKKKAHFNDDDS